MEVRSHPGVGDGAAAPPKLLLATDLGAATGGLAVAAGVAVTLAAERGDARVLMTTLTDGRWRGPTMLASEAARGLETRLREQGFQRVAARGRLCWLGLPATEEGLMRLFEGLAAPDGASHAVVQVPARLWPLAIDGEGILPDGGMLRADLPADRALAALAVAELRERGLRVRVATRPLGRVASRRALAGLELGGAAATRVSRLARGLTGAARTAQFVAERGQALLMVLGAAFAILFAATVLAALGGAVTGTARAQRAADLVALSGARSLRDDFARLFVPTRLPSGARNPRHLDKGTYLARALAAARQAAERNGVDPRNLRVSFPDARSFAPLRVRAVIGASVERRERIDSSAEAEAAPPSSEVPRSTPATAGEYSGPLAYRLGKPMRPDVADAFDRMAAAARRAGFSLTINSAYRSNAEQARLFAQTPDPRWVAPPGKSLHRCATELDLGPPSAYAWLDAHARRFGLLRRYSWEPWHFGYVRGPAPCSAAGNAVGASPAEGGEREPSTGLPAFVPSRFRDPIERSAARWNVSAGLLAAQLMAESNFNPYAVSGAGARGIAQFMPATARSYGLRDPFDAPEAIDAQAHLMFDLLRQFGGSVPLALAAYNAGPGPVADCHCVPPIPETEAYVARILGLMGGAGELTAPALEVRLVD